MNLKNIAMGLGLWFVISFALHGADVKKGEVAYIKKAETLTATHKNFEAKIKQDADAS